MKTIQQNGASVARDHPGFIAIAGPFAVQHPKEEFAKKYQDQAVSAYREQKKICPKARIVMHGTQAWVIRKKPLIVDASTKAKTFTSGNLGIKGGRSFVENKERVRV